MLRQQHNRRSGGQVTIGFGGLAVAAVLMATTLPPVICSEEPPVIAIRGGTVLSMAGEPIRNGIVLIRGGKIAAVGANVTIPQGATIVDATGKHVMPGIVDAMTYYGIGPYDLNETSPVTPQNRAIQGFYPFGDPWRGTPGPIRSKDILNGGVTTIYIAPGDRQVIGGQGAVVKTAGKNFDSLILREPAAIDMTLGEPAKQPGTHTEPRSPSTRMGIVALLRKPLVSAQEYERTWSTYEAKSDEEKAKAEKPKRDLGMEALAKLLRREIPARVQADLVDDIRTAISVAEEFGFELILDSGLVAYKLKDHLAAKKIPVVLGPTSHPLVTGYGETDLNYRMVDERNAAMLAGAGVKIAIASFSRGSGGLIHATTGRWLLLEAALATAYGLSDDEALRAVTINAAKILGVSDRVGSLEPGKDADVIILDGPPLSIKSWVERVYVNGELVYSR